MSDQETNGAPPDPDTRSDTLVRDPSGRFVSPSAAQPEEEAPTETRKLSERLPIRAVGELLELLTLVETYRNPQTRYLFRPMAKEAGYDVGTPDPVRPDMYTPGELEALISAHCGRPPVLEAVR